MSSSFATTEKHLRLFKLDKLDGSNYPTWAIRMQIALSECKCKSLVLGTETRPVATAEDAAGSLAASTWDERNEFALHRIQMAVSDRNLLRIAACETAKEAWDILKTSHKVEGTARKLIVQKKLRDLRMDEGSSAQAYIEEFETLVAEAESLNMDVIKNPEQLALQFLSGLPPSLETFADVVSLQYQESEKVLTPKLVTTSLLSHIVRISRTCHLGSAPG